jgi:uncharacterized protein YjbI with pentapeptide repeats
MLRLFISKQKIPLKNILESSIKVPYTFVNNSDRLEYNPSFNRIGLLWNNIRKMIPFGSTKYKLSINYFSKELINYLKQYKNNIIVDLITCSLSTTKFLEEIKELKSIIPHVTFNYSVNKTGGAIDSDWIMENSGESIKEIYFNNNIYLFNAYLDFVPSPSYYHNVKTFVDISYFTDPSNPVNPTLLISESINGVSELINFNFEFDGAVYTQFSVNTNGVLTFDKLAPDHYDVLSSFIDSYGPLITPLYFNFRSSVQYAITNNKLIVQWDNVKGVSDEDNLSIPSGKFQVILYKFIDKIEFNYSGIQIINPIFPSSTIDFNMGMMKIDTNFQIRYPTYVSYTSSDPNHIVSPVEISDIVQHYYFNSNSINLTGHDLSKCDLTRANFSEANLTNVILSLSTLVNSNLTHTSLTGITLTDANISGLNLNNKNLSNATLLGSLNITGTSFTGANFNGANMENIYFERKDLSGCSFVSSILSNSSFISCNLTDADFTSANITGTNFNKSIMIRTKFDTTTTMINVTFTNVDLREVNLNGENLSGSNLNSADLSGSTIDGSNLSNSDLSFVNFSGTILINTDFSNSLLSSVDLTGKDLSGDIFTDAVLSNAILVGATITASTIFTGSNLSHATLDGLDLSDKDLTGCDLTNSNMQNVNLTSAILTGATLSGADLTGADLTDLDLSGKDLSNVILTDAILTGVNMSDTDITGAVFSEERRPIIYTGPINVILYNLSYSYGNLNSVLIPEPTIGDLGGSLKYMLDNYKTGTEVGFDEPIRRNEPFIANIVLVNDDIKYNNMYIIVNVIPLNYLTISGITIEDKTYNSSTNATIAGTPVLNWIIPEYPNVTIESDLAIAVFNNKNVGSNKPITVTGYYLSGTDAHHYELIQPTDLTADITQLTLTIGGLSINDKIYDKTTNAFDYLVGSPIVANKYVGDTINIIGTPTAVYGNINVGISPVYVNGYTLDGVDKDNYIFSVPQTTLSGNILQLDININATIANKRYDGSTTVNPILITFTLTTVISPDIVNVNYVSATYNSAEIGNRLVTITGITISGADALNYNLLENELNNLPAVISPFDHVDATINAYCAGKIYDGTKTASVILSSIEISPIDDVVIHPVPPDNGLYEQFDIGTNILVTVNGITLIGPDAEYYSLINTTATTYADITNRTVTIINAFAMDKSYDGTNIAYIKYGVLQNVATGDDVTLVQSGTFASSNPAYNIVVTSTCTIIGDDVHKYTLIQPTLNNANIIALGGDRLSDVIHELSYGKDQIIIFQDDNDPHEMEADVYRNPVSNVYIPVGTEFIHNRFDLEMKVRDGTVNLIVYVDSKESSYQSNQITQLQLYYKALDANNISVISRENPLFIHMKKVGNYSFTLYKYENNVPRQVFDHDTYHIYTDPDDENYFVIEIYENSYMTIEAPFNIEPKIYTSPSVPFAIDPYNIIPFTDNTYISSDESEATIDDDGLITMQGIGTTILTVTGTYNGLTATTNITLTIIHDPSKLVDKYGKIYDYTNQSELIGPTGELNTLVGVDKYGEKHGLIKFSGMEYDAEHNLNCNIEYRDGVEIYEAGFCYSLLNVKPTIRNIPLVGTVNLDGNHVTLPLEKDLNNTYHIRCYVVCNSNVFFSDVINV